MIAPLPVAVVGYVNVKHACYVAEQFQDVNVPIAPAISSTEVARTAIVIGPSGSLLGSVLTLRSGKHYFADLSSQQMRSPDSYALLRAFGIDDPEARFAGTLWPVVKAVPRPFSVVSCSLGERTN